MKHSSRILLCLTFLGLAGCATSEQIALRPVSNEMPPPPPETYDISRVTKVPSARFQAAPRYPFELRKNGVTGNAVVLFTVLTDGTVRDVMVLTATDARFGDAAVEAVQKWRFQPAQVDGRVVNCRMSVPMGFTLTNE